MNRHYIIASHAHFAKGLYESVKLLMGERADVHVLNAFVDGHDDVEKEALALVDAFSNDTDVVVLTDLMGGSINNEFTKLMLSRKNVYVVTNINLPLVLTLFLSDETENTVDLLRQLVANTEVHPKLVNDVSTLEEDETF
ncbi:PTS sugar transporter subunit IIA [Lancefieldella sp. Marseille-Q7238]|uniref:PTS sugar transporter subunit IIA n=1 Tax=Lancefieldella sp. Marseille-Q7238 TaxID=3022127 RepID=UPI0024A95C45|nr:PTS sugar transporter subunit IIA [Lancefieldella sp. Marseille-Q7238]